MSEVLCLPSIPHILQVCKIIFSSFRSFSFPSSMSFLQVFLASSSISSFWKSFRSPLSVAVVSSHSGGLLCGCVWGEHSTCVWKGRLPSWRVSDSCCNWTSAELTSADSCWRSWQRRHFSAFVQVPIGEPQCCYGNVGIASRVREGAVFGHRLCVCVCVCVGGGGTTGVKVEHFLNYGSFYIVLSFVFVFLM